MKGMIFGLISNIALHIEIWSLSAEMFLFALFIYSVPGNALADSKEKTPPPIKICVVKKSEDKVLYQVQMDFMVSAKDQGDDDKKQKKAMVKAVKEYLNDSLKSLEKMKCEKEKPEATGSNPEVEFVMH